MGSQLIPIDTVSRLIAGALNAVLYDLETDHTVDGVAVFRLETQYVVDLSLLHRTSGDGWSMCLHFEVTPPEEENHA